MPPGREPRRPARRPSTTFQVPTPSSPRPTIPTSARRGGGEPRRAQRPPASLDRGRADSLARYAKLRRRMEAERQRIRELRARLAREAATKKAKEAAERRIKAAENRVRAMKEKNKDLLDKHVPDREYVSAMLRNERRAQEREEAEASQGRMRREIPPNIFGANDKRNPMTGEHVGAEVLDAITLEKTKSLATGRGADALSLENTNIEDVRLFLAKEDGTTALKKPTTEEWYSIVANSQAGDDATDDATQLLDPERVKNGYTKILNVVGAKGLLFVRGEATTSTPVPGETRRKTLKGWTWGDPEPVERGFQWQKPKDDTAMYANPDMVTPGEYKTMRQMKEQYAKMAVDDPDAFRELQTQLAKAGYYDDMSPEMILSGKPVVSGYWDKETRKALNQFFHDASLDGPANQMDFDDLLREKSIYLAETFGAEAGYGGGGGGGGGGGATSYSATDPATLGLYAEDAAKTVTGRMPTPEEKAEAIAAVQAAEAAEGGKTSGAIISVDPQAVMIDYFRKKVPDESGAKNMSDAFESFASIIGAGGAIGQGGGAISMGNPKIGS